MKTVIPAVVLVLLVSCASSRTSHTGAPRRRRTAVTVTRPVTTTTTTVTTPSTTVIPTTAPAPSFGFAVATLDSVSGRVVGSSWRAGCPVPLAQLRHLTLSYWGFDGAVHDGDLIVNVDAVDAMRSAFARLFSEHFPIRSIRLVDDFGADDFASIEADNTSAFNCRERSTGGGVWSQHAYGRAIDVNPIENPYIDHGGTTHPASRTYLDRSNHRSGMAFDGGQLVAAFATAGWGWGGHWSNPVDTQHFSASGN